MYLESIVSVSETENRMRQKKADAAAAAKKRVAETKAAGEVMVADALKKAEAELVQLRHSADEAAKTEARALADNNETKKAVMRARAENRMDKAVELIVERIVNG